MATPMAGEVEQRGKELQRFQALASQVVDAAPEAIYVVSALTHRLIGANTAFRKLLGYSPTEIGQLSIYDFVQDTREHTKARFERVLQSAEAIRGDREYRRKNGTVLRVETSAFLLQRSHPQLVCTTVRDVTERRRMEGQLRWYRDQLRILTSQLHLAEERERRRVAQALHDQAGQLLAAASIRLDAVQSHLCTENELSTSLQQVGHWLHGAMDALRSLTLELSPPVLHQQGLCKAVEWLAGNFASQHGIPVRVHAEAEMLPLDEELSVVLFQSLRELLINVLKHAQAHSVDVRLRTGHGRVQMTVQDDGVGFNPATRLKPEAQPLGGFGLFSMGERMVHLGGRLEIASTPGAGTAITLHLPLRVREG